MSTSSTTSTPPLSLSLSLAKREREEVVVIVIDDDDSAAANQLKRPCFAPGEVIVIDEEEDSQIASIRRAKAAAEIDPRLSLVDQSKIFRVLHLHIPDRYTFSRYDSSEPWHPGHVANDYLSRHRHASKGKAEADLADALEWVKLHSLTNIACYDPSFRYFWQTDGTHVPFALRLRFLNERHDVEDFLSELFDDARGDRRIAALIQTTYGSLVPIAFRVEMVRCYVTPDSNLAWWLDFVFGCYEIVTPAFVMETIEVFEQLRPGATDSERIALALRDQPHRDSEVLRCFRRYPLRRVLQQLPWWPIFRQDPHRKIGIFSSSFGLDTNVLLLIASFLDTVQSGRVV